MFRALLIACCLTSFPALADGAAAIGELVNQRLSLMKDVAGYKAQQHLPIEDLAQEAKVLASAQAEAGRLGLEPASVRPFIAAQMDAAKAIQYRYRADWLASPEPGARLAAAPVGAGAPTDRAAEQPDIATAGGATAYRPARRGGSGGVYGVCGSGESQRRRQAAAGGCAAGGQNRQRTL
ncbi:putative chorismate mutase precursor, partial [Serratia marcescens subsp. marcescens Db11]